MHENGDLKHVMIVGDDFLFFDFETVFRSRTACARSWRARSSAT